MVEAGSFTEGEIFQISVTYNWFGSPRPDFTVKAYSVDGKDILDEDGDTNMLSADGNSELPSEFDYIEDEWSNSDGRAGDDESFSGNRFLIGYTGCLDTAFDATDSYGDGCEWYTSP